MTVVEDRGAPELTVIEFRSMGSPCRIVTAGGEPGLAERARRLVESLEQQWSRFLPGSEVSSMNRVAGAVTVVSEPTFRLVAKAVTATGLTSGRFNPLMLEQLCSLGYERPWQDDRRPVPDGTPVDPATDEPIVLYPDASAIRLPAGARFDPGGIGKGLAVDLAIEQCIAGGATTAMVDLGGDLRVHGQPWYGAEWAIGVVDPFEADGNFATFTPTHGAVTTSTTRRRRWHAGGRTLHHLLDPATGQPSTADIVAVTTCAAEAWWAEVAAKTALLEGSEGAVRYLEELGVPGVVVTTDGRLLRYDQPSGDADHTTEQGAV
jgi:thiamine biosynthesis lipoprotein